MLYLYCKGGMAKDKPSETMNYIKTFEPDSKEFQKLWAVTEMMNAYKTDPNKYYRVRDCYFDLGRDWIWTTIIAYDDTETGVLHSWQAICPADQKIILTGNLKEVSAIIEKVVTEK